MPSRPPFEALSLDFWFTSLYYPLGGESPWRASRVRVLQELLRPRDGSVLSARRVGAAMDETGSRLARTGWDPNTVSPAAQVEAYAETLDARLALPAAEAGRRFSDAGLLEHPPQVNPEVAELFGKLADRRVPVIAITNTSRQESSWKAFLSTRPGLDFRHIVTSCEVGSSKPEVPIFHEAARRLGVPVRRILHVGDRWELDILGARAAGCGAALYRGLWGTYPPGYYDELAPPVLDPEVACLDHLDEILERQLLA